MAAGPFFGCPAHDQRDLDFANAYSLPIIPVVRPRDAGDDFSVRAEAFTGSGVLFNSGEWSGLDVEKAKAAAIDKIEELGAGSRKGDLSFA